MGLLVRFMGGLERMMAAAAFAEAGSWDMARAIMNEQGYAEFGRPLSRKRAFAEPKTLAAYIRRIRSSNREVADDEKDSTGGGGDDSKQKCARLRPEPLQPHPGRT